MISIVGWYWLKLKTTTSRLHFSGSKTVCVPPWVLEAPPERAPVTPVIVLFVLLKGTSPGAFEGGVGAAFSHPWSGNRLVTSSLLQPTGPKTLGALEASLEVHQMNLATSAANQSAWNLWMCCYCGNLFCVSHFSSSVFNTHKVSFCDSSSSCGPLVVFVSSQVVLGSQRLRTSWFIQPVYSTYLRGTGCTHHLTHVVCVSMRFYNNPVILQVHGWVTIPPCERPLAWFRWLTAPR